MEGELFSGVSAQGMVDRLCELAVERKASDVHAEPLAEGGRIRLRRHGVMENLGYLSGRRFSSLINCFKVMAHMHLEENRIPQDGSCRRRIAGEEVSFRFSVIPSPLRGSGGYACAAAVSAICGWHAPWHVALSEGSVYP